MSFLRAVCRAFDYIGVGLWVLSGVILLFSIASVIADVVLRLFSTRFSLPWVVEVNEYALFAVTFFSSVWCLRKSGHIRIDFIFDLFGQRTRELLAMITSSLGASACLVFCFYAGYATWYSFSRGTHLFKFLKVPKYAFTIVICICAFLMAVEFIRQALEGWKILRRSVDSEGEGRT